MVEIVACISIIKLGVIKIMHIQDLIDAQESRRRKSVKNKIVDQIEINKELTDLWNSNVEKEWSLALERYWPLIQSGNISLEKDMENLNANDIKEMTADEFYYFLHDKYFVWKFVEYRSTIQGYLERYQNENRISDLKIIKDRIFNFDLQDTKQGLRIATSYQYPWTRYSWCFRTTCFVVS